MTLLVLLLFFLFRMSSNAFRRNPTPWVGMLFGILVFGFLHGFVDVDFNLGAYQLGVWFLAGCLAQNFLEERKKRIALSPLLPGIACLLFFVLS